MRRWKVALKVEIIVAADSYDEAVSSAMAMALARDLDMEEDYVYELTENDLKAPHNKILIDGF